MLRSQRELAALCLCSFAQVWQAFAVALEHSIKPLVVVQVFVSGGGGSAEEKIPATIQDIEAWPIPGLVVFAGEGFTANMKSFLISTGKAVELDELEPWFAMVRDGSRLQFST
jgi:hypothetical protein